MASQPKLRRQMMNQQRLVDKSAVRLCAESVTTLAVVERDSGLGTQRDVRVVIPAVLFCIVELNLIAPIGVVQSAELEGVTLNVVEGILVSTAGGEFHFLRSTPTVEIANEARLEATAVRSEQENSVVMRNCLYARIVVVLEVLADVDVSAGLGITYVSLAFVAILDGSLVARNILRQSGSPS